MISDYFVKIRKIISEFSHIVIDYSIREKVYSEEKGFIEGVIIFSDNSSLDFAEVKNIEIKEKLKYRYHYMDSKQVLIFRYDNTKHFPELNNFPHHKHIPSKVIGCTEPNFKKLLKEIERIVLK